jgi:hypothetical protein
MFVALFTRSGAIIAQPSVQNTYWSHMMWSDPPEPSMRFCSLRFVPVVEVMSPLMSSEAVSMVYRHLFLAGATSDFGLDLVWCNYLGTQRAEANKRQQQQTEKRRRSLMSDLDLDDGSELPAPQNVSLSLQRRSLLSSLSQKEEEEDAMTACAVIDAVVAEKLAHEGHGYDLHKAMSDMHNVEHKFSKFEYPQHARALTKGACVPSCAAQERQRTHNQQQQQQHPAAPKPQQPPPLRSAREKRRWRRLRRRQLLETKKKDAWCGGCSGNTECKYIASKKKPMCVPPGSLAVGTTAAVQSQQAPKPPPKTPAKAATAKTPEAPSRAPYKWTPPVRKDESDLVKSWVQISKPTKGDRNARLSGEWCL